MRLDETSAGGPFQVTLVAAAELGSGWSVPVVVFPAVDAEPSRLPLGSTVEVTGRMVPADPGEAAAFLLFASEPVAALAPAPPLLLATEGLRRGLRGAAGELPGDGGVLLPGLAIGDDSAVADDLDAAMTASSLSHLTAVSGANCAVVVGLVMVSTGRLGVPRRGRVLAALLALAGFVLLVTPQPSVIRAAVMAAVVLVALVRGRPAGGVPVLGFAVLVLLVIDPWLARDYGFVLSVLATAGLLLFAGPIAALLSRWMPHWLAAVLAMPVAAQLACQPVLILLAPSIPTFGVVANVLAGPAAPLATVLGLMACLCLPLLPWLGHALVGLAWLPASWISAVARFFAAAPGASLPWLEGFGGVALLVLASTAVLLVVLVRGRRLRFLSGVALALIVVGYLGVTAGDVLRVGLTRPGDWQIAACDIGQGDAVLVRSAGRVALIDTGPAAGPLAECLDELGIRHLDLLVLTHFDRDHVGGTEAVLGMVDAALVGPPADGLDQRLLDDLAAHGAEIHRAWRGMTGTLGALDWRVLWPRERPTPEPGNDASVILQVDCQEGCISALFLGDLGERAQTTLSAVDGLDRVDVVKVSHHGSADQSAALYERVRASVGLIGVGVDNGYGHPTDRLLAILARVGTTAARTDVEGMILLSAGDDGVVELWSERPP
ncbi:ComEC/Rec2 family competence protein [soil metagenome]